MSLDNIVRPISTKEKKRNRRAWWHRPYSQLLGRLRQEDSLGPGVQGFSNLVSCHCIEDLVKERGKWGRKKKLGGREGGNTWRKGWERGRKRKTEGIEGGREREGEKGKRKERKKRGKK